MAKKKDTVVMQAQDLQQVSAQQRALQVIVKAFTYLFLGVMALIVLFPFYWMIISSLKELSEYRENIPTLWPRKMVFFNYVDAFNTADLGQLFLNTAYVGIVSTMLSLYSEFMARWLKTPATPFAVMTLIPLIPGGSLYYSIDFAVSGNWESFAAKAAHTAGLAAALSVGIVLVHTVCRNIKWHTQCHK
jgi:ABC-type glycerol-3-phosphate transport system permease component